MSAHYVKKTGWLVKSGNQFLTTDNGKAEWNSNLIGGGAVYFSTEEEAKKRISRIKANNVVVVSVDENTPTKKLFRVSSGYSVGDVSIDVFEIPTFCDKINVFGDETKLFYDVENVKKCAYNVRIQEIKKKRKEIEKIRKELEDLQQGLVVLECQTESQIDVLVTEGINRNLDTLEHNKKLDAEIALDQKKREERKQKRLLAKKAEQ